MLDVRSLTLGTALSNSELFRAATENENSFPSMLRAAAGRRIYTLDGPGYFVLKDSSGEVYARSVSLHAAPDGSVVDDWGRAIATDGRRMAQAGKSLVDADGFTRRGRLRLATFQAPNELRPDGAVWHATRASGSPRYTSVGEANVAVVREGAAQPDMPRVHAYLRELWMSSGRASLELAMAAAKDGFTRTALGLVK